MKDIPTKYRKNVAVIVINKEGKILVCHRNDSSREWSEQSSPWQFPQGGVDDGESMKESMYRELEEEIGTKDVEIIDKLPNALVYDWPKELYGRGYRGQEQYYFLVRINKLAKINLNSHDEPEFSEYKWLRVSEFKKTLKGFKKEVYVKALEAFIKRNPDLICE